MFVVHKYNKYNYGLLGSCIKRLETLPLLLAFFFSKSHFLSRIIEYIVGCSHNYFLRHWTKRWQFIPVPARKNDKLYFMIKHKTNYFNLTVNFYELGRKDPRKRENTTLNILHIVINLFSPEFSIFLSDMGKTCFCSLLQVGKSYFRCHIFWANQKQQKSQEAF